MTPALFVTILAITQTEPEHERSIALDHEYRADHALDLAPNNTSYTNLYEHALLHSLVLTEESGGFSSIDPEKISLFGSSTHWTTFTWNHLNLTDPFFAGAAAIRIPARMIDTLGLRYAETPASTTTGEGPSFYTGPKDRWPGPSASAALTIPTAGGIMPASVGLTGIFSGTHPTARRPSPPDERRRFQRRLVLDLLDQTNFKTTTLRWGIELDAGARRFLEFTSPEGNNSGIFTEPYLLISSAALLTPEDQTWQASFAAEYRRRNNLYAELHHARAETLAADSAALFAGYSDETLKASATLKWLHFNHENTEFTRDLLDPDGESLAPYFPNGQVLATTLDARWTKGPLFLHATETAQLYFAKTDRWSHTLLTGGEPYGRLDLRSQTSFLYSGDQRAGVADHADVDRLRIDYALYATAAIAANASGKNTLFLPDAGAKAIFTYRAETPETFEPFLAFAKTPLPISHDLIRKLDPHWLSGEYYLQNDTTPIDALGGEAISVSPGLVRPNIYSGAIGARMWPARGWRLTLQGLLRAYTNTPWLALEGGPSAHGSFDPANNRYYFNEGTNRRYLLTNYPFDLPPFYAGFHLQLYRRIGDRFIFELSFAALNAIGRTAFGNGVSANDLGVVDESTGNPNSSIEGLANLDGDRAFLFKWLIGYRFFEGFWFSAIARHKDGQPFAFFDDQTRDGQLSRAYAANRGSPLKYSRPLAGPREDFQLEISLSATYEYELAGLHFSTRVECINFWDFGNELQERSNESGRNGRASLELQIPRALTLTQVIGF